MTTKHESEQDGTGIVRKFIRSLPLVAGAATVTASVIVASAYAAYVGTSAVGFNSPVPELSAQITAVIIAMAVCWRVLLKVAGHIGNIREKHLVDEIEGDC